MKQRTRFLGLDVHKQTIPVAVCEEVGRPEPYSSIPNQPEALRKLVKTVSRNQAVRLVAAYEAGPTGFVIHRQLARLGVECVVAAPSLLPRRSGDRVKTDRRAGLTAQQRLHLRYRHLSARLGRPRAVTAVARELAGFIWAVGQLPVAAAA